ncbi:alginate lyase family protein [Chloroflexota bacterium]
MTTTYYWWPDLDSSDGRPYVRRDGQVNPESKTDYYDKASLGNMISSVSTLGLAHYLFGEDAYGIHAAPTAQDLVY